MVPDCNDASDECNNCSTSRLSSDKYIIGNFYLRYTGYLIDIFFSRCNGSESFVLSPCTICFV